jgi:four helix bundle protein
VQCRSAAVLQCCSAAVLQCHSATVRGTAYALPFGMGAKSFEELYAWQLAVQLRERVIAVCENPRVARDFKFCDAFREAARSAPNLIAEGFGRYGPREFRRYLTMARAELLEVQNDVLDLKSRRWVSDEEVEELRDLADHAARVTSKLRSSIRER